MSPSTQRPPLPVHPAKLLGATQTFVSKLERGERRVDPVELAELAAVYGKGFDYFLLRPAVGSGAGGPAEPVERTVALEAEEALALEKAAYARGVQTRGR